MIKLLRFAEPQQLLFIIPTLIDYVPTTMGCQQRTVRAEAYCFFIISLPTVMAFMLRGIRSWWRSGSVL